MAILRNCCCCKVRTACIIFSVLGIVDSFIRFMSNISDIWDFVAKSEYQEQEEVDAFMEVHKFLEVDITEDDVRRALTVIFTMSCIDIVFSGLALLTCITLLIGVVKERQRLLIPSLYFIPVDLAVGTVFILAISGTIGFLNPISYIFILANVANIVVLGLVWLVVWSHRQQINDQLTNNEEWEEEEDLNKFSMA